MEVPVQNCRGTNRYKTVLGDREMLKKAKVAFLLIMALVFALQSVPVAQAEVINKLTAEYIFDSLGDAVNYGVVTREWEKRAHAETSACVEELYWFNEDNFANSDNTYAHSTGYPLDVVISAPAGMNLQGLEFALFEKDASGWKMCPGTKQSVGTAGNSASLEWDVADQYGNSRIYVMQVDANGNPIEDSVGEVDITYGPSLSTEAKNDNYVGKIISPGTFAEIQFFNMLDYFPSVTFGPVTRLYADDKGQVELKPGQAGDYGMVYINYFYPEGYTIDKNNDQQREDLMNGVYPLTETYAKFGGFAFKDGHLVKDNKIVYFDYEDRTDFVDDLLYDAFLLSKELGNMGGGELDSTEVKPEGGSSVTGPVDAKGHVVSLYDVEVGMEKDKDGNYTFSLGEDTSIDGIPVAGNEYVIVNLICPSKDCSVKMSNISYYHEGGKEDQVSWGSADSNSSQHVIYNFVYADEDGILQPFEGTIIPHNGHGGTLLAPKALVSVTAQVHNGALISDKVDNNQEIHGRVLKNINRSTWIKMNGGYVTVHKVSWTYNTPALAGAVFGVFTDEDCTNKVCEMTTGSDGYAKSEMLPAGTYYVKEIKAPNGYSAGLYGSNPVVAVTVEAGKTVKAEGPGGYLGQMHLAAGSFVNEQSHQMEFKGDLRIEKRVTETGDPLKGATFGIYSNSSCDEDSLVATMRTNSSGVAVYEGLTINYDYEDWEWVNNQYVPKTIPYYVKEISAPNGYLIDNSSAVAVYLENGKMVTVDGNGNADGKAFTNSIIRGNLALKKVDANTGAGLQGAEFTIYSDKDCTQPVGEVMTTDANGVATSANVIEG